MFVQQVSWGMKKIGLSLPLLAGLAGLGVQSALAAPIPNISSLQDLKDTGSTGVVIGDKQFYNFQYTGSPTSGSNPAPTASQISVAETPPPIGAPSGDIGISFSYAWESANGLNEDSVITYCVHTLSGTTTPTMMIDGVKLNFNGATPVPGTGTDASLTNATVTEKVYDLKGNLLGGLSTFDDGKTSTDQASLTLAPTRDVCVSKDIIVHSAPISDGGGVATISVVDNTFHQTVPEPASLGLFALGLPMLVRRRRAR
jgi:hypothetical protein